MSRNQNLKNQLLSDLNSVYHFKIQPKEFSLTEYQQGAIVAVLANYTSVPIKTATPTYSLGRVYSFNVLPELKPDPILIISDDGDLNPYYEMWSDVVQKGVWQDAWLRKLSVNKFNKTIKHFVETCTELSSHEIIFAVIEMLKFKNSNILRLNIHQDSTFWFPST